MKRIKLALNISSKKQAYIIIILLTLTISLTGLWIFTAEKNRIIHQKEGTLKAIATLKAKQVHDWYNEEIGDAHEISNNRFLHELLTTFLKFPSDSTFTRLTDILLQYKYEHELSDVILATVDGQVIASATKSIERLASHEIASISTSTETGKTVTTDLFRISENGEEKIFISFTTTVTLNDKSLYSLVFRINPNDFLYPLIESWPIPSQTAESYIFRGEGDSIVFLSNLRHENITALSFKLPIRNDKYSLKAILDGSSNFFARKDYRGVQVKSYATKINGTPWYLVAEIDKSELLQDIPRMALLTILQVVFIVLFAVIAISYFYRTRQKNIYEKLYNAEKEIWQHQEKFRVTLDSLGDGVIVTDMKKKIQYMNLYAEELTGWRFREARGRDLREVYSVINEQTGLIENNILEKVLKHGIVKELANHTVLIAKGGRKIPVMDTGAPIHNSDGEVSGIVIAFQNETERRLQQRLLRESEEKYRKLFEEDLTGDYIATAVGKIVDCNPAFTSMLGYNSKDEILENEIVSFYAAPSEREHFLNQLKAKKTLLNLEIELKKKDGSIISCIENVVGKFDEQGNLMQYSGYMYDVTEKKRAQEDLMRKEQVLSSILATQQELICRSLPNTTITFANTAFCKIFDHTENELIGQKFLKFLPESEWDNELARLAQLSQSNPSVNSITPAIKFDGSIITIEWTDVAIFDSQGEIVEIQSVGRDITEKLKAEQNIIFQSQMQEMLRTIASTYINIPLEQVNDEINKSLAMLGRFVDADRVYIFEYDWSKNTCNNTHEWCQEGIEPQIQALQNVPLDGIPQWVNTHMNGKTLYIPDVFELDINNSVRQILEPQGIKSLITIPIMHHEMCIGFLGFDSVRKHHTYSESDEKLLFVYAQLLVNIKNRQILENQLVLEKEKANEGNRLKTAFLQNISHEIRTPMNGIIGFTDLLKGNLQDPKVLMEYIEVIELSGNRLMRIISDLIDLSKIETGQINLELVELNVNGVIGELEYFFKNVADEKGLEVRVGNLLPESDCIITSDNGKLYQVLSNLLYNATKFSEKGIIEFGCEWKGDSVQFYVKDQGIGIPKDKQGIIFKRFIQGDTSISRGYEGAGLGLSISKSYVEKMGGKIWVESELNVGSIFYFTIPNQLKSNNDTIMTKVPKSEVTSKTLRSLKVLIVDDDRISSLLLEKVVCEISDDVFLAKNGNEAIDICLKNEDIHLILMDLKMPHIDGFTTTQEIRKFNKDVVIVAQSAYAYPEDIEKAIESGCNHYITKPLNRKGLIQLINSYIVQM